MNKNILIVLFVTIFSTLLLSEELSKYNFIKIKTMPIGKEEGMIGWQNPAGGGYSGPVTFAISNKYMIYIPDRINYRINVYDINLNFIKAIIEKKEESSFPFVMKIDNNDNIIYSYIKSDYGLIKINNRGEKIFNKDVNDLPIQVSQYDNFFPLNDDIFIYNDQNEIECISSNGKIEKTDIAKGILKKLSDKEEKRVSTNELQLPDDKKKIIANLKNIPGYLIYNDNFYSTEFYKVKEYFEKIKDVRDYVKAENDKIGNSSNNKKADINTDDYSMILIGYDNNFNSYWKGLKNEKNNIKNYVVIIFSKYGEILDAFIYGQQIRTKKSFINSKNEKITYDDYEHNTELYPTTDSAVTVAPNGDVYFLVVPMTLVNRNVEGDIKIVGEKVYTFYKVERKW